MNKVFTSNAVVATRAGARITKAARESLAPTAQVAAAVGLAVLTGAVLATWPGAAFVIVLLGLLYLWILADWRRGVLALAVVLPFAGLPAFLIDSKYALIARDVAIGLPLYASLLVAALMGREHLRLRRSWLTLVISSFGILVVLHVLLAPSLLIGLVGAKVWIFYIPMMGVGYLYVRSAGDAFWLLKLTALIAVVPAILGIAEWVVSARTGTLGPFRQLYGALGEKVDAQYVKTSGVGFSRIPSTFTSVSQYASFCYVALTATLAVLLVKRSVWWLAVVAVVGLATMTSGERGAFVVAPLLVWLGLSLSSFRLRGSLVALLATVTLVGAIAAHGTNVHAYRHELSVVAAADGSHAVGEFSRSLRRIVGDGTGSRTNAALRYGNGDVNQNVENWYARAGVELGVAGLFLAIVLLGSVVVTARQAWSRLTGVTQDIGGPIAALILTTALISFKGSFLDFDPFNVYFWLFAGVLLRLPLLDSGPDG